MKNTYGSRHWFGAILISTYLFVSHVYYYLLTDCSTILNCVSVDGALESNEPILRLVGFAKWPYAYFLPVWPIALYAFYLVWPRDVPSEESSA